MLPEVDGYEVIGGAADGATAMIQARRLRPDLVLLDVQLLSGGALAELFA